VVTGRLQLLVCFGALLVAGGIAAAIVLAFSGSSQAAPTKAKYFASVAKICAAYGPKLDRISPPDDVTIPGEVVTPLKRVIALLRAETAAVQALVPPHELVANVRRWLALKARVLASLERTLHAAETPDIAGTAVDYLAFQKLARQAGSAGHAIGFPMICSSSG
jgi:hypothetical protein